MPGNVQKIPLVYSATAATIKRVQQALNITGKSLPCSIVTVISSGIVTVQFEMNAAPFSLPRVTVPVHGSEYQRVPFQVGTKGYVNTADFYLGGVSGLGGGTADLTQRGNLTSLVFSPLGNTGWSTAQVDPNLHVLYGPNGVRLMDEGRNCIFTLTPTGITITVAGKTWTWTASGMTVTGTIQATGDIQASTAGPNISMTYHIHNGVQPGSGDTAVPVPDT